MEINFSFLQKTSILSPALNSLLRSKKKRIFDSFLDYPTPGLGSKISLSF